MPIKLTSSDSKTIVVAVLMAAFSLAIGIKYFSHAFQRRRFSSA